MIKQAAAVLLLASAGCASPSIGSPDKYEVRLDPSMTSDQSELVMNAWKDWHVHTDVSYSLVVSSETCAAKETPTSGCVYIRYGSIDEANSACGAPAPGHTHVGCTLTKLLDGHVYVANVILSSLGDYTKDNAIALHEIGHSINLAHPLNPDGSEHHGELMTANMEDGYPEITELDVIQFNQVHGN